MTEEKYDVLISLVRQNPNSETRNAEALFNKFINQNFSYDEISAHPDWPAFASAELLNDILPQIIDEMLKRGDTGNFLIYPVISSIDPLAHDEYPAYKERTYKLIALANPHFAKKACQFLLAVEKDPPNGPKQVQRLLSFWKNKLEELQAE